MQEKFEHSARPPRPYSIDKLLTLVERAPKLEKAEEALAKAGHAQAAEALSKLQQDAGVEIAASFGTTSIGALHDENAREPGPEEARVLREYKPITDARFERVMRNAYARLPEGPGREAFMDVAREMGIAPPALPATAPAPR